MTSKRRIDYVGLLWRNDADYFQAEVLPTIQTIEDLCKRMEATPGRIKYKVQAARSGQGSTYEVDAWGWCADYLTCYMPVAWWLRLTRLDYRVELADWDNDEIHTFSSEVHRRGVPGFNTAPLNKRDAAKTDRRGIGGQGIQIGSWRSARSLTIYKRRREQAAVEIRLNSKMAGPIGAEIHEYLQLNPDVGGNVESLAAGRWHMNEFLKTTIKTTDVDEFIQVVLADVRDREEFISEMAGRRDSQLRGQMDFWETVANELPGETGTFEVC